MPSHKEPCPLPTAENPDQYPIKGEETLCCPFINLMEFGSLGMGTANSSLNNT